ncbi:uncharacterized protein C8Q71DRAFT_396301 [Rhodofomes roseus]|uniref:Uncharacterized protein n=1 Tax=Rhodofomes roseus TaxID=34475 RepID=A0ABQ8JZF5_9APHY|nr:uncharacterized protein C8Q71DRAFT_396301 [Rhodofomes roseus]KAH9829651.1 hypothetical protein C8Q71DRAFT_396301 [Rhodofomes roseus]
MAPVLSSPPSAPSGMSSLFASIGDRKQIIVYAAIVVILFAIFLFAAIYILRLYNASPESEDEESHNTSTPRPPLRLLLPGMVQQRTSSSTSTLVGCATPPQNCPPPAKRSGSAPSPLRQHVHIDPLPVASEQSQVSCVPIVTPGERPTNALPEDQADSIVGPKATTEAAEETVPTEPEIIPDPVGSKTKWLQTDPALKVEADIADMMILTFDMNKPPGPLDKHDPSEIDGDSKFADEVAANIGNTFLQMVKTLSSPKALKSPAPAPSAGAKSPRHIEMMLGPEGNTSVTQVSSNSAKCGLLSFRQEPRRGDLWAAALDRLARHVSLDDIDADNPPIREPTRVLEDPIDDQEVRKPDHTTHYEIANPPEPSIGGTSLPGDKFASSGTSVPAFGCRTAKTAADDTVTSDFSSALSHGKPRKGVRFAGDFNAEVGDRCRISYNVTAGYLKVKVADSIATLPPLSSGSLSDLPSPSLTEPTHGSADQIADIVGSCGPLALSTAERGGPALATEASSECHPTGSPPISALNVDDEDCKPIIVYENHLDEDADRNFYELGISYSTQALRNLVMKNVERSFAQRQEEQRKRCEEIDKLYSSFHEGHLNDGAATAYTPPLSPDLANYHGHAYDSGDSDSGSSSPATPALGFWPDTAHAPTITKGTSAATTDTWKFLPGNTAGDTGFAVSASGNLCGLALQLEYDVGDDVPLPPRRVLETSPSDEMKPILVVEEHLDENAERNFYEFGISYSTQALRNLLMKECEKTSKRRRLEFEVAKAVAEGQKKQQRTEPADIPGNHGSDLGPGDDTLSSAYSCETISDDGQRSCGQAPEPMAASPTADPHQEDMASQEMSRSGSFQALVRQSAQRSDSLVSDSGVSIMDQATRPGRFSKLLMSFYNGYDFSVAAAIAVGLEINIEDCDTGKVVTLYDDYYNHDDYPDGTVLAEEPSLEMLQNIDTKSASSQHLRVPETMWTAPRLDSSVLDASGNADLQAGQFRNRPAGFEGLF